MSGRYVFVCLVYSLFCGPCLPAAAHDADQSTSREQDTRTASSSPAAPGQESDVYKSLAARLIDAATDADRAALLQANSNLMTAAEESALSDLAEAHRSRGEFAAARVGFQLMQRVAEKNGHPAAVAAALRNLGIAARLQQRYAEALDCFQKSLDIAQSLRDQKLIALILLSMSAAYAEQSDYEKALAVLKQSLEIAEAIEDKALAARVLTNLGAATQQQHGNSSAALEYYQRALAIDVAENPPPTANIANVLLDLGALYADQGDNARAMQHYRRSLALLGAHREAAMRVVLLQDIAWIYESQGQDAQALDYAGKVLALSKRIGNKAEAAAAYTTIANIEANQGRYAQSLEAYRKSLALLQEIGVRRGTAYALTMMGEMQLRRRRYADAAAALQKALDLGESIGIPDITARAYVTLAKVQYRQGNFAGGLALATQASEVARRAELHGTLWTSRTMEGRAYRALGRTTEAREALEDAITNIEALRSQVAGGQESQSSFFRGAVTPYDEMVELLVGRKQYPEALGYAERAKGRVLLDVLVGGRANVTKTMTPAERDQEQRFHSDLASLNRRIQQETEKTASDVPHLAELRAELEKTRLAYADFQVNLYVTHPELKVQRGQFQPVTTEEAGHLLPDAHSALLEYVVAEEKSYLFVLTRQAGSDGIDLKVHAIAVAAKDLEKKAQKFRQQLAQRDLGFRPAAAELFELLLGPARQQLAGKMALIIVPDGALWDLPFQALLEGGDRYLVENHAIGYAPSATVLREMARLHAQHRQQTSTSPLSTLLAMGDPDLGRKGDHQRKSPSEDNSESEVVLAYRGEKLGPLPEARREVAALKDLYGSERSEVYVGGDARESRFKSEAGRFRILHLATHGILDNASPMYSNVLLSRGNDSGEDGLLEAREIMQMDLKADLAVLSACETARGRISAGEGVIGLTWAFFVAGTPTTVVSQWNVESVSTAALMLTFHRTLQAQEQRGDNLFATAKALRRAEVQMLHSRQHAHPFYWAGFVVVGDPN